MSSGTFQNASDRRIKTEIGEIAGGLDLVMKLRPIRYVAKQAEGFQKIALTGKVLLGMMADELQEVVPEVVYGEPNDPDQLQSVNYTGLVPVLIAAVQELTGRLSKLEQGVH